MKSFRERRAWLVGITSILLISIGVGLAFSVNRFQGLRGVYTIAADLRDAAGLQPGNEVRVAGVKVGTVKKITLRPDAARVSLEIENDIRLPVETRVEIKLKTLLGQKFVDLQLPRNFVAAGSGGNDPIAATGGFLEAGDVIPRSQTKVPFEIYQAATEGTAVLEGIDKRALRKMLDVLSRTVGTSKDSLRDALVSIDRAGVVLSDKSVGIKHLLRNTQKVTGTLADSGTDIEGILQNGADVLEVLADRRAELSSLLAATNDLSGDLGLLIRAVRGDVHAGSADLNSIVSLLEGELETIEVALDRLPVAQEMFGRPVTFGRFAEGHVCAVTTEDTCVPKGSPDDPGAPIKGTQPPPSGKVLP